MDVGFSEGSKPLVVQRAGGVCTFSFCIPSFRLTQKSFESESDWWRCRVRSLLLPTSLVGSFKKKLLLCGRSLEWCYNMSFDLIYNLQCCATSVLETP